MEILTNGEKYKIIEIMESKRSQRRWEGRWPKSTGEAQKVASERAGTSLPLRLDLRVQG